jgi:hypothetical protein
VDDLKDITHDDSQASTQMEACSSYVSHDSRLIHSLPFPAFSQCLSMVDAQLYPGYLWPLLKGHHKHTGWSFWHQMVHNNQENVESFISTKVLLTSSSARPSRDSLSNSELRGELAACFPQLCDIKYIVMSREHP